MLIITQRRFTGRKLSLYVSSYRAESSCSIFLIRQLMLRSCQQALQAEKLSDF